MAPCVAFESSLGAARRGRQTRPNQCSRGHPRIELPRSERFRPRERDENPGRYVPCLVGAIRFKDRRNVGIQISANRGRQLRARYGQADPIGRCAKQRNWSFSTSKFGNWIGKLTKGTRITKNCSSSISTWITSSLSLQRSGSHRAGLSSSNRPTAATTPRIRRNPRPARRDRYPTSPV